MTGSAERFLLVDTSDRIAMVGIYDQTRVLAEFRTGSGRPSLEWVSRSVSDAQKQSGLALRDLQFLACGIGPGGFTSVRIGMSFLKAVGQTTNLPMVGVNRLEAAAAGFALLHPAFGPVQYVVKLPAGRDLEFAAIYKMSAEGMPVCVRPPAAVSPKKFGSSRIPKSALWVTPQPDIFYMGLPRVALLKFRARLAQSPVTILPMYLRGATLGPRKAALKVAPNLEIR